MSLTKHSIQDRIVTAEEHVKPSGKRYVYYRCTGKTAGKCPERAIAEREIERQVRVALSELQERPYQLLDESKNKKTSLGIAKAGHDTAVPSRLLLPEPEEVKQPTTDLPILALVFFPIGAEGLLEIVHCGTDPTDRIRREAKQLSHKIPPGRNRNASGLHQHFLPAWKAQKRSLVQNCFHNIISRYTCQYVALADVKWNQIIAEITAFSEFFESADDPVTGLVGAVPRKLHR